MILNEACGLLTTDVDHRILTMNRTLAGYLGREPGDLLGMPVHTLFPPGGRIVFQTQLLPQLSLRRRLDEFYLTLLRADGSELPVIINAVPPAQDPDSALHWAIIPMHRRDLLETELINARVKAQEALMAKDEAMRAAEAATRAKTAFLASMSHEIRTPMNAVLGMTSLLLQSAQIPEQRDWTETIRSSGEHLLELINDVLDYSKIESGRFELEHQAFALPECLDAAINLVARSAGAHDLDLTCRIHAGVAEMIVGDPARLRQIVLSLLSNAIKFTPEGGEITVDVLPGQGRPDELQFSVRDSGIGLSEEQQSRLFQPFAQADASTSRLYGGTGLGLSICRRLVEAMGGRIWVNSRPGQGATFHFTIVPGPCSEPGSGLLQESPALRGRRALIVDPASRANGEVLHYCRLWGLDVQTAASLAEAQAALRRGERYDIALLDLGSTRPYPAGLQELATEGARLAVPKRVLTANAPPESARAGYDAVIVSPLNPAQLREALKGLQPQPETATRSSQQLPQQLGVNHPLRILIAEDNPVNVKLAKLLFNHMNYQPDFAGNGVEVLAAVERQPYDVIFMDVRMPIMDGLQATRQLCENQPAGLRPRIVGMSASAMDEDRTEALTAGMDDYITKPIVFEQLVQSLEQCARRGESGQSGAVSF